MRWRFKARKWSENEREIWIGRERKSVDIDEGGGGERLKELQTNRCREYCIALSLSLSLRSVSKKKKKKEKEKRNENVRERKRESLRARKWECFNGCFFFFLLLLHSWKFLSLLSLYSLIQFSHSSSLLVFVCFYFIIFYYILFFNCAVSETSTPRRHL